MVRFATPLLAAIAFATPALADEPPVVVLRGSSAPPTPWYEPPPEPKVVVQPVPVPIYYYPVLGSGPIIHRHGPRAMPRGNR